MKNDTTPQLSFEFDNETSLSRKQESSCVVVAQAKRSRYCIDTDESQTEWAKELASSLSMETPDWRKLASPNTEDCDIILLQNLVQEIIVQAIDDYKTLSDKGYVKNFKSLHKTSDECVLMGINTPIEIKDILDFFAPKGSMEQWIDMAGLNVDHKTIRKALLQYEKQHAERQN